MTQCNIGHETYVRQPFIINRLHQSRVLNNNNNNLVSVLIVWWGPCRVVSCVVGSSVFSWQNSATLCPASYCTPRPNLPISPGISWLPTFAFQSLWWKGHLWGVLFLEGLVGFHRTVRLQLLQDYWSGIDLDYHDIEWFALEMNEDPSVVFEIASKYCILDSFVDYDGYSISSKGFLPTVVDIMVISVKFIHLD